MIKGQDKKLRGCRKSGFRVDRRVVKGQRSSWFKYVLRKGEDTEVGRG